MQSYSKSFEELTAAEFHEIVKERIAVFVVEQQCPYQEVDDIDLTAIHHYYKLADEIIAYTRIYTQGDTAYIGRVLVKETQRKQKLGQKLMLSSLEIANQYFPEKELEIGAQAHLQEFYGRLGFVPISSIYLEDDIPHIKMRCGKNKKAL